MYKILLCLLLQAIVADFNSHNPQHNWRHAENPSTQRRFYGIDGDFRKLTYEVVSSDRTAQRICNANVKRLTETFHGSYYELSVDLPEFNQEEIKVQRKHRVLRVQAVRYTERNFTDVMVLPKQVDPGDASWSFSQGRLVISVRYRAPFGVPLAQDCNADINDGLVDVPNGMDVDSRNWRIVH